jgi:hypothetical protein
MSNIAHSKRRGGIIMSTFLFTSIATKLASGFTTTPSSRNIMTRPMKTLFQKQMRGECHYNSLTNRIGMRQSMSSLSAADALSDDQVNEIEDQIKAKGDEIRQLKADGLDKAGIAPRVAELLALKAKIAPPEEPKAPKKVKAPKQQKQKKPQPKKESEMTESELRSNRLQKAELMREAGVEPYAYSYDPTHTAMELQDLYEGKLEGGEEDEESNVAVAGRIMAKRVFGKLAFFTLQDESGTIQLHLEKNRLGDTFKVCFLRLFTLM